jgi:hypothetical protein
MSAPRGSRPGRTERQLRRGPVSSGAGAPARSPRPADAAATGYSRAYPNSDLCKVRADSHQHARRDALTAPEGHRGQWPGRRAPQRSAACVRARCGRDRPHVRESCANGALAHGLDPSVDCQGVLPSSSDATVSHRLTEAGSGTDAASHCQPSATAVCGCWDPVDWGESSSTVGEKRPGGLACLRYVPVAPPVPGSLLDLKMAAADDRPAAPVVRVFGLGAIRRSRRGDQPAGFSSCSMESGDGIRNCRCCWRPDGSVRAA